MYIVIYPFTGLATNHCPENGLSHLKTIECPNVNNGNLYKHEWCRPKNMF